MELTIMIPGMLSLGVFAGLGIWFSWANLSGYYDR